jgi:hypothetical protein
MKHLVYALVLVFSLSSLRAADFPLTQSRFTTDAAVAAAARTRPANTFQADAPKPRVSKTKIAVIAAVIGAVVVGILFSRNGAAKAESRPVAPPTSGGEFGSTVIINGIPQ